jgi:pilus assembly protein CpaF
LLDQGAFGGTRVNGERVEEFGPLAEFDEIRIAGFSLRLVGELDSQASQVVEIDRLPAQPSSPPTAAPTAAPTTTAPSTPTALVSQTQPAIAVVTASTSSTDLLLLEWQRRLHRGLIEAIDLRRYDVRQLSDHQLRTQVGTVLRDLLGSTHVPPASLDQDLLWQRVLDEAIGLGPLEPLLADPTITEIMVNAADAIWVERGGRLEQHAARFTDDDAIRAVIDRIVAPLGRRIDEASPMVDARLADGSRVNAIIPPLAVRGPALTIRRFSTRVLGTDDLLRLGSASGAMLEFLRVCVASRRNLIVSGGTGSGKTTLLNILSNLIPPGERLITIEDAAELRLVYPHLVTLEARPANLEGRGAITIRDLVRNALRMRPDRIIVGECRGGEALDMLQAMNTGHEGSLTTVHANTARDALSRLEMMVLMAGIDLPIAVVREQIASAIDLVVHQARGADGVRRIQSILEVTGNEAGRLQTQEIFRYVQRSPAGSDPRDRVGGHFEACDAVPQFYEALAQAGWDLKYEGFARAGSQCR